MTHRLTVGESLTTDTGLAAVSRKVVTLSTISGAVSTGAGSLRWYNDFGCPVRVVSTRAAVGTAPTGATLIVDVNLNGTSIFATTQANRPTIAASGFTAQGGAPDTVTVPVGGYLTADVDQVGSTVAGSNLTVTAVLVPAVL